MKTKGSILHPHRLGYPKARFGSAPSTQLSGEYGRGFGRRSLFRMIQFAEPFPDGQIVSAPSAQLSWSHFVEILPLKDPLERGFYREANCRRLSIARR